MAWNLDDPGIMALIKAATKKGTNLATSGISQGVTAGQIKPVSSTAAGTVPALKPGDMGWNPPKPGSPDYIPVAPGANPVDVYKDAPVPIPTAPAPTPAITLAPELPMATGKTPSIYTPEYYAKIRESVLGEAASPAEQERARQQRSILAGKGILSGSAYDTLQTQRVGEFATRADEAVREAMLKGAEWETEAPEREKAALRDQASMLQPLIESGAADEPTKQLYNRIMNKLFGAGTVATPGTEPVASPIDFTKPSPTTEIETQNKVLAPKLDQADMDYSYVSDNIPGWVTDPSHLDRPVNKAWQRYDDLARKIEGIQGGKAVSITQDEIDEFNLLSDAFKRYIAAGGDALANDPVFMAYASPAGGATGSRMFMGVDLNKYPYLT